MTSLLNLNAQQEPAVAAVKSEAPALPSIPSPSSIHQEPEEVPALAVSAFEEAPTDPVDFEIVFGRLQIASTGILILAVLAFFSGISYLIGKSTASKASLAQTADSAPVHVEEAKAPAPKAAPVPVPAAAPVLPSPVAQNQASNQTPSQLKTNNAPLFAEAVAGQTYLQVGAIDKGLAGIWAEGLRTHGLNAFVSPGTNNQFSRVMIGPLPDSQAYQHAKDTLEKLGVSMFGRKYTQ